MNYVIMLLHILLHTKDLAGVLKNCRWLYQEKMKSAIVRFSAGAFTAFVLYPSLAVYRNISDKQEFSDERDFIKGTSKNHRLKP